VTRCVIIPGLGLAGSEQRLATGAEAGLRQPGPGAGLEVVAP